MTESKKELEEVNAQSDEATVVANNSDTVWRNRISLFFAALIPLVFVVAFLSDLFDNGKIDNAWLVLGLFIFGGALSGQAVEKIVNRFFG